MQHDRRAESEATVSRDDSVFVAGSEDSAIVISCDDCAMRHTRVCDDCLVTFVLNREDSSAVVIDAEEARAVRMLTRAGLVPAPKHVRRAG